LINRLNYLISSSFNLCIAAVLIEFVICSWFVGCQKHLYKRWCFQGVFKGWKEQCKEWWKDDDLSLWVFIRTRTKAV